MSVRSFLACAALGLSAVAGAADSELDTSFGIFSTGRNVIPINGGGSNSDYVAEVLVAPDNSIYLVGSSNVQGTNDFRLTVVHLLPNGVLDTDFGTNGRYVAPQGTGNTLANSATFDSQGDILIGGTRRITSSDTDFTVCKIRGAGLAVFSGTNTACVIVPINLGGTLQDTAYRMKRLPDGRLLLMGTADAGAGPDHAALALLKADGTLDTSFGNGGKVHTLRDGLIRAELHGAALTGDILFAVGEGVTNPGGHRGALVVKVRLSDGAVVGDSLNFLGTDTGPAYYRDAIEVPGFGLIAVGTATSTGKRRGVAASLSGAGEPYGNWASGDGYSLMLGGDAIDLKRITQQSDGKFLVSGTFLASGGASSQLMVGRYNAGGGVDYTFNLLQGYRAIDFQMPGAFDGGAVLAVQNGRPIVAGSISVQSNTADFDFGVARLQNDLVFSNAFGPAPNLD
ncbi:hypothetical protein [Tahibacter amnicola]|uniref:Delta-60 repeat protein n=1 Tax=Tahibacter amnicola TaxID=2976241 RepID=A0ABY6BQW1_9GAMM|nr:hypothetical protein [Tahibacter amnicola]UXI70152.1 hypothetical protein N4264_11125 [Tahibacter amnicola]